MNPKRVPSRLELKKHLDGGLSQGEIAAMYGVSRSAIAMAKQRYELEAGATQSRYMDLLPWRLRPEHKMHWDARMLRLEGRRRQGKTLTDKELVSLQGWRDQLEDQNAVIYYNPRSKAGFHWVARRPEDKDIIRRPAEK